MSQNFIYLNYGHFLFLQSVSGIRNICKLYVLSSKGAKFHPGYIHSSQITIKIESSSIWQGGVGGSCRLQHLESPGSIPSRAPFSRRGGYILFYFETWFVDSFAYYLFSFYYFSMKFMYNVNRTSPDGRIAPPLFLTNCWATKTNSTYL